VPLARLLLDARKRHADAADFSGAVVNTLRKFDLNGACVMCVCSQQAKRGLSRRLVRARQSINQSINAPGSVLPQHHHLTHFFPFKTHTHTAKVNGTGPSALHLAIAALGVPATSEPAADEEGRKARVEMVALLLEHGPRIFRCACLFDLVCLCVLFVLTYLFIQPTKNETRSVAGKTPLELLQHKLAAPGLTDAQRGEMGEVSVCL
jgi:hypothetical protein